MDGGNGTKHKLSMKDIADIETAINARGVTEAIVSVDEGKVKVVMAEKKLIS